MRIIRILKNNWFSLLSNPWQTKYVIPIIIINTFGSVYGYYWYAEQMYLTPVKFWLFVPDSPLSTTMLVVVLVLSLAGYRNVYFTAIAFAANIKYGLWAVVIISDFWIGGGGIRYEEVMLWISHLGMALQGTIYLVASPMAGGNNIAKLLVVLSSWLLLNDIFDYYVGIHPYLFYPTQYLFAAYSAAVLSVFVILLIIFLSLKKFSVDRR